MPLRHVLFYALGGGLGHVTRSLALARELIKREVRSTIVSNSDRLPHVTMSLPDGVQLKALPCETSPSQSQAFFETQLNSQPAALVVDTFPRGIGGELVGLFECFPQALRVLVSRTLPERYLNEFEVLDFVRDQYGLILSPGGESPFEGLQLPPMLIRNADEIMSRSAARKALHCDAKRLVLLVASGRQEEVDLMVWLWHELKARQTDDRIQFRIAAAGDAKGADCIKHWPLLEVLSASDLVVGAAGYHLHQETTACRINRLLFPFDRNYDDQSLRADVSKADMLEAIGSTGGLKSFLLHRTVEAIQTLEESKFDIATSNPEMVGVPDFVNGASIASQRIVNLLASY